VKFSKVKITSRERWVVAVAPTLIILGVYFVYIVGGLNDELSKQQDRVAKATDVLKTPAPTGPSPALVKAKGDLADKLRQIDDQNATLQKLGQQKETVAKQVAVKQNDRHAAAAIEQIQAIFAKNHITPALSEPADPQHVPQDLVSALTPPQSAGGGPSGPRIWHLVIDGQLSQFRSALDELVAETTAVPLSLNIVYNPDDDGQSRLLELWLLY
jgi:hypothetical protein